MLTRLEKARDTWGGAHTAIDAWLSERQHLLVQYCKLAGLPPYDKERKLLPTREVLETFCELLVDYVSTGHFEVYDRIVAQCQVNGERNMALAHKLYPRLTDTTDAALEFNDRYADNYDEEQLDDFYRDLTALGRALEVRFELEDQMIAAIYNDHRGDAAA